MEGLADLRAAIRELGAGGVDVVDDEVRAPQGTGRRQLDDAEVLVGDEVGVLPPSQRLVELLGPVDIRDGYDDDLAFHVHTRNPLAGPGSFEMQYLVTMTTHVPDGVSEEEVDNVRAREAARSRELATAGHLLRLWRPPLQPGEWRSFGLFAADDADHLEKLLASMPLRVWRNDEVTPLAAHPNDPPSPPPRRHGAGEFLTTFALNVLDTVDAPTVDEAQAAEARSARKLADRGYLVRLWKLPGQGRALGLWQAETADELQTVLAALPLRPWLAIETIPLTAHPSDPAQP